MALPHPRLSEPDSKRVAIRPKRCRVRIWTRVVELAGRRHDIVTVEEMLALGMSRGAIKRQVRAGHLHRVHRGVYTLGTPALTREGRWLAAVRGCGPGALLSHLSGAALWAMRWVDPIVIDVIAPRGCRRRDGIRVHRVGRLERDEHDAHLGIPVTSPARTWFDLASMLGHHSLRRALSQGERDEILDPVALAARLRSRRGVRGQAVARAILASYRPAPAGRGFRSDLERAFWEAWLETGLEEPEVNHLACGIEVDMLWRSRKLAVELDGGDYHRTHEDRARDERNTAILRAAGHTVLRFSDEEVDADLDAVIAAVAVAYHDPREPSEPISKRVAM